MWTDEGEKPWWMKMTNKTVKTVDTYKMGEKAGEVQRERSEVNRWREGEDEGERERMREGENERERMREGESEGGRE